MSNSEENKALQTILYLMLAGVGLWLLWLLLKLLYYSFAYVGFNGFLSVELSAYGRLTRGGWPAYALLGLGLGACAGAAAAWRRYRLHWGVGAGSGGLAILLLLLLWVGSRASFATTRLDLDPTMMRESNLRLTYNYLLGHPGFAVPSDFDDFAEQMHDSTRARALFDFLQHQQSNLTSDFDDFVRDLFEVTENNQELPSVETTDSTVTVTSDLSTHSASTSTNRKRTVQKTSVQQDNALGEANANALDASINATNDTSYAKDIGDAQGEDAPKASFRNDSTYFTTINGQYTKVTINKSGHVTKTKWQQPIEQPTVGQSGGLGGVSMNGGQVGYQPVSQTEDRPAESINPAAGKWAADAVYRGMQGTVFRGADAFAATVMFEGERKTRAEVVEAIEADLLATVAEHPTLVRIRSPNAPVNNSMDPALGTQIVEYTELRREVGVNPKFHRVRLVLDAQHKIQSFETID